MNTIKPMNSMQIKYTFSKQDNYQSLNELLKVKFQISTNLLSKLINSNSITINNSNCNTRKMYPQSSLLKISFNYEENSDNIVATKMNLNIIYEDEWLIIVNKPSGIPIHPSRLHYSDSLSNGIKFYFESIGLKKKIRPVNRLDLYTSGRVIFAKCEYIQECLIRQMKKHIFKKSYLALASDRFEKFDEIINKPIGRKEGSIIERCIDYNNGKQAITHYRVLKEYNDCSLILCTIQTGRTHQIRVHMNSIGHPLIGDSLYFKANPNFKGQALHCYKLTFIHPITNNLITFKTLPLWINFTESFQSL